MHVSRPCDAGKESRSHGVNPFLLRRPPPRAPATEGCRRGSPLQRNRGRTGVTGQPPRTPLPPQVFVPAPHGWKRVATISLRPPPASRRSRLFAGDPVLVAHRPNARADHRQSPGRLGSHDVPAPSNCQRIGGRCPIPCAWPRGVAQLAERWSPKPEVAGSIPVAPVTPGRTPVADGDRSLVSS